MTPIALILNDLSYQKMKTKARRFAIKLIAVLLGILLALVLAEVFYRVFHFATHRNLEDIQAGRLPVVQPDREMKLGQVIQISRHRKIVYELIPGSKYQFQGVPVQTNEQGFRDRNYLKIKRKGVRRIIGLGDSVMFGWGVTEQNCFLTQLENDLNRQDSFVFEILNTGVPGYNSVMEVATLREKIDLPGVDMVILNFVGNDLDLPNFIRKKPAYLGIKKSFILQRFEASDGMDGRLRAAPFDKKKGAYENRLENVPPEYQAFVGEPAFSAALQELRKMAQEHGFQVLVL